jgi:hypothetical protein
MDWKLYSASFLMLGIGLASSATWVLVDVEEEGPDPTRIVVPAPVFAAEWVTRMVDCDRIRIPLRLQSNREAVSRLVEELRAMPDAEIARIEEKGRTVVVVKREGLLRVRVDGAGEDVEVRIPLEAVTQALESCAGDTCSVADLLHALRSAPQGDLVRVQSGSRQVRIKVM